MSGVLAVSEVFGPTIQGEGPSSGKLAMFVRLFGCNLNCWWCDTPYTWVTSDVKASLHFSGTKFKVGDESRLWDISGLAFELRSYSPSLLVITGGEPMLQQPAVAQLLQALNGHFDQIELETAGTIPVEELAAFKVHYNVSPKLSSSRNELAKRYLRPVLKDFVTKYSGEFKFVIGNASDVDEAVTMVHDLSIPRNRVWLMPEGALHNQEMYAFVAEQAINRGYNFSARVHTLIWGNKRGV